MTADSQASNGEAFLPRPEPSSFGHHFLIGLQKSPVLTDHDKRLLAALRPSGVVLFRDNFAHGEPYSEWLALHSRQLKEVREVLEREDPLICIDHEGGLVSRTPPPVTHFAAASQWADRAREVGGAMGRELRALGVNVSFAPVADINLNPDNPVIGGRALGDTPTSVASAALDFLSGLQGEGVLGCAKHFPGHGATDVDSHEELPVVNDSLAVLREREFVPFAALIDAGVSMVMTAHIHFPAVAPDLPATLSSKFLRGILRGELGFEGVVVSDDVGMRAVADRFGKRDGAARAVAAGCDLIPVCAHLADTSFALTLAEGIAESWGNRSLPDEVLETSHRRIVALRRSARQHSVEELPEAVFSAHRQLAPMMS